jgi:hypothetical protein
MPWRAQETSGDWIRNKTTFSTSFDRRGSQFVAMDIRRKNVLLAIVIAVIALMLYIGSIVKLITTSSGQ